MSRALAGSLRRLTWVALLVVLTGALARAQLPVGDLARLATCAELGRLQSWRTFQNTGYQTLADDGTPQQAPPQDAEGRFVLLDVDGPGCVTRLWSAPVSGSLRIWIDGEPRLEAPWTALTYRWWDALRYQPDKRVVDAAAVAPFFCPLADGGRDLGMLMVPLGFAKHCKITLDEAPQQNLYGVDYTLTPGAEVAAFTPEAYRPDQSPLREALGVWREPGDFFVTDPAWTVAAGRDTLAAGRSLTLLQTPGSGQVRLLTVDLPQATVLAGRALVLRGYWDGETSPRLEVPLGDLAGMGFALGNPSAPAGVRIGDFTRFYCRLPMPFARGARVTLTNESPWVIPDVKWRLHSETLPEGAPGYGRLCAYTRRLQPAADAQTLTLLEVPGRGHLAGYNMSVWEVNWGEGPLRWTAHAFLDGEAQPRYSGAALLDFNFGNRTYLYQSAVAQVTGSAAHDHMAGPDQPGTLRQRVNFYRYMIEDVARFEQGCRVTLQRAPGAASFGQADLTWLLYVAPETARWWPPLDPAHLPWPVTRSGATYQAEDLAATATVTTGTLSVVPDRWGSFGLDGGAMLSYAASRPGDTLTLQIPAPAPGYYTLTIRQIGSPGAADYRLRRSGTEWRPWWSAYSPVPGKFVAHDPEPWGVWYLDRGPNAFDFFLAPESWQTGALLSLDSLWLSPVSSRTNALEAETLPVARATACRVEPEPAGSRWASGWGRLHLEPTGPGATATLRVPLEATPAEGLLLVGYQAAPGTRWEALWDGEPLGPVVAGDLSAPFERRLAWFALPPPGVGDHEFTVRLAGPGPLWLDFLGWGDRTVWEVETLPFTTAATFEMRDFVRPGDPAPTRNVALRLSASNPAQPLTLGLPALQAGRYRLGIWLQPEGVRRLQPTLNDTALPAVDLPPGGTPTRLELGTVELREGLNVLSLGVDGYVRLDAIETTLE